MVLMRRLEGRTAIVSGAAQGIGYAIARRLYDEGCRVGLLDISEDKLREAAGSMEGCAAFVCDVSSVASITEAVKGATQALGSLDIVVNNAGILHNTTILETTEAQWDRIMAVNLKSVFFMVQQAIPFLKESKFPRVINISSLAGRMGGFETGLGYSASKGGILALTMGFARQLAPFGINVNAVCPGTTETPITKEFTPEAMEKLYARIPLGRLGKPEDTAAAVAYLASDDAAFVTGLLLDVNGGMYMG